MKISSIGSGALLLLFVFRLPAAAEVVFQAKVSPLSQVVSSYSEGKDPGGLAEVALPGELFDPPRASPVRKKEEADLSTVENAFATEKSAIIADDEGWILSNWVAEERHTIEKFLANGELRKKNRDFMKENRDMKVAGIVELKGHALVLIAGQGMVFAYKNVEGRWLRSNALFADEDFGVVFSAWRLSGKVFER